MAAFIAIMNLEEPRSKISFDFHFDSSFGANVEMMNAARQR